MNRKIVFDLVRDLVGRGFRQSEVDALDDALDRAENLSQDSVPCVPSRRISLHLLPGPAARPGRPFSQLHNTRVPVTRARD